MAGETPKSCDCGWLRALCEKLQRDLERKETENKYIKDLLWKSPGSWAEKEQALEEDIVMASEEVVDENGNEKMD